ncbi:MAG: hypothetical protein GY711_04475 [bacterium]|nr:hypothetical protein [bacterium]
MMKFQYLTSLLTGGVLLVPAVALRGQDGPVSITDALSKTVSALEELTGIRDQVANGDTTGVRRILHATEMPILDPRGRDERLVTLRGELSALQLMLDELRSSRAKGQPVPTGFGGQPGAQPRIPTATQLVSEPPAPSTATTGLSESLRASIARRSRGEVEKPVLPSAETVEHEAPGFSADVKRQGILLVRGGRHLDAIRVLMPIEKDPEAKYWIARSFQRLGRDQEARELLRQIIDDQTSNVFGTRAQHDLEFLEIKAQIETSRQPRGDGK